MKKILIAIVLLVVAMLIVGCTGDGQATKVLYDSDELSDEDKTTEMSHADSEEVMKRLKGLVYVS